MRFFLLAAAFVATLAAGFVGGWLYGTKRPLCHRNPTQALTVVDGDTIKLGAQLLRIENLDAPETHRPRCNAERALGEQATQALDIALRSGELGIFPNGNLDKFYR